jgi:hypothetical protein
LLASTYRQEFADQGLDIAHHKWKYHLISWANRLLTPMNRSFFRVAVAEEDGSVVGTTTAYHVDKDRWYIGMSAMDPRFRARGIYKMLMRFISGKIVNAGGMWAGCEVLEDNHGSLHVASNILCGEVFPVKQLFLTKFNQGQEYLPSQRLPIRSIGDKEFQGRVELASIQPRFQGGYLIEQTVNRDLLSCIRGLYLPPITIRSYILERGGRLQAFARTRVHWPSKIRYAEAIHFSPGIDRVTARDFLLTILQKTSRNQAPFRIYAEDGDKLLLSLCMELGFISWCRLYPIRMDLKAALKAVD